MAKTKKITAEEQEENFWNQVDQQSHYLIADLLKQVLPLPNLRDKKNLDLEKDADYRTLLFECENNYSGRESDLPSKTLAEEIAYEYLLLVVRSLLKNLSNFDYHIPDYFTELTHA